MSKNLYHLNPGLQSKLSWFYNKFVAREKVGKWDSKNKKEIERKLWRKFPGYKKIYKFRNDVSHGFVNQSIGNLDEAYKLRQQAKDIVDELFRIAKKNGYIIPRETTYQDVLASQMIKLEIDSNPFDSSFIFSADSSS